MPAIRRAIAADAPALAEFNRHLALETEQRELDAAAVLGGVKAVLDNPAHGFYVVAESDANDGDKAGELVASLMITREWSDWRNGEFWWIQSVYVSRAWRRRGVYRMLYNHVKQLARECQVCGFRLYVEADNRIAQNTYAALGMHQTPYLLFEQAAQ